VIPRRRAIWVALLCASTLALPAATAQAKLLKAIWGPYASPVESVACPTPPQPCSPFAIYRELGVDVFQFQVHWNEVASTQPAHPRDSNDPAYDWEAVDTVVQQAAQYGIRPAALVQLSPRWANRGRLPIWGPSNPKAFADFLYAASRRYPSIRMWMIWGEPSRGENFQPMRRGQRKGPRTYATLLDKAYASLKQVSRRNVVIGGMTLNGGTIMAPDFVESLKLKNGRPPRMDMWGHNPFEARFPRLHDDPLGAYRGFNDIDTLHEEIKEAYQAGHRKVPRLWLSEWTIVSDRPLSLFSGYFVSKREQATRLKAAYQIAGRAPYVAGLGWFTLMDQAVEDGNAGWGLLKANGTKKPAFDAYKSVP
jgi:hypothetical protein